MRLAEEDQRQRQAQSDLAIQLALDPAIISVRYVPSLDHLDRIVPIQMLVAETSDGRVAFDIVDHRPERDLDEDGLLLLTLQQHGIRLVEIECATIESEPRASNCRSIWRYRDKRVAAEVADAIDRTVAKRSNPTVRALGRKVGLRHPMPTVCALICRKRLEADLGERVFGLFSVVRRPARPVYALSPAEAEGRNVKSTTVRDIQYGETK
jgi:hypothetical protein